MACSHAGAGLIGLPARLERSTLTVLRAHRPRSRALRKSSGRGVCLRMAAGCRLLCAGGVLIVNEALTTSAFVQITFGMTDGWWLMIED